MKKLLVLILRLTLLTAAFALIGCKSEHKKEKAPAKNEAPEAVKEAFKTMDETFKALDFLDERRRHNPPKKPGAPETHKEQGKH